MRKGLFILFSLIMLLGLQGCRTYYEKNRQFNDYFQQGKMEQAEQTLEKIKNPDKKKDRVLYYLNMGVVDFMLGKPTESNAAFEKAITLSNGMGNNYFLVAGSYLTNPNLLPYKADNFEMLMVHYYMALNYLNLKKYEDALVECRRMDEELQVLDNKYKNANKYQHDAFVNNLMGIIYDAQHDYNNAFIAYRNAYNIYQEDYTKLFGISAPEQLKEDLLRTAYLTGLPQEVSYYEKQFGTNYHYTVPGDSGEVVFFWLNGLGPVKDEWSINFAIVHGEGGLVTFVNEEYGWSFPFYMDNANDTSTGLGKLEFVRVVMPKYVERPEVFSSATLIVGDRKIPLQLGQDINKVAFQSLQDRLLKELGESLLRLALKKAAEYTIRKQNEGIGAAVGIVNFITEQADTRNWQTLPHSIYYARIKLPPGQQEIKLEENGARQSSAQVFKFDIKPKQTTFQSYHALASWFGY